MQYSACIEMLFTEYPFVERIYKAKKAGFDAVEFWDWQAKDLKAIKKALRETALKVGIFQGNTDGRMTDPKDRDLYIAGVMKSLEPAKMLGSKFLFLMSDILKADRTVQESTTPISADQKREATMAVLRALRPVAEQAKITFVIEPLNTYVDHKGYSLNHSQPAFEMVREIGSPNFKVVYDIYHMQIMEGNIIHTIRNNMDAIGYFHLADVPGRNQPGTGELNYTNILKTVRALKYKGIVGFEFAPIGASSAKVVRDTFKLFRELRGQ
ncbi:MAG: TIM barrel protein [Terriglobia bacterium]|jgi:hydroxypyruvate isomerase